MAIETLSDIVGVLANQIGVYGAHDHNDDDANDWKDCDCRCCFESGLIAAILEAVRIEKIIGKAATEQERKP